MTAPLLLAYREGAQLLAWCDQCRAEHEHGVCCGPEQCTHGCPTARAGFCGGFERRCDCPVGNGDGHRWAHCYTGRGEAYQESGYYIVEVDRVTHDRVRAARLVRT